MSSARLALRLRCTAIRNRQLGRPACAAVNATAPRSQIRNYLEPAPLCYRPLPKVNPDDVLDPALAEYFKEESNTEAPEAGDNATTAVPPTPETTPEPTKFSRTGPKKNPEQERDHKLNDERTINLGKSELAPLLQRRHALTLLSSSSYIATTSAVSSDLSTADIYPCTIDSSTPLSKYTPTSACCSRSCCIHCSTLDQPVGLG